MSLLQVNRPCSECPWRKDQPPERFPCERYAALEPTCRPGGLPGVFACHKTTDATPRACAGFLLVVGDQNNRVRWWQRSGAIDLAKVHAGGLELFESFDEMARANGHEPGPVDELGHPLGGNVVRV